MSGSIPDDQGFRLRQEIFLLKFLLCFLQVIKWCRFLKQAGAL